MYKEHICYAGSPLKYSFSEAKHKKSVVIIDCKEKGNISYKKVPLAPLHDLVQIKGTFEEIIDRVGIEKENNYTSVILIDEEEVPNAFGRLTIYYPKLMQLGYDNSRTKKISQNENLEEEITNQNPMELMNRLYYQQLGANLTDNQQKYLQKTMEEIWEGEE